MNKDEYQSKEKNQTEKNNNKNKMIVMVKKGLYLDKRDSIVTLRRELISVGWK